MNDSALNPFNPYRLSVMLDEEMLPLLGSLVEDLDPRAPLLTFGGLHVAEFLSNYGRTTLASRAAFSGVFEQARESGIEVRVAAPEEGLSLPPRRFGLVHTRWTPASANVIINAMRWLRPGGVLVVELPDTYPALSLPRSPYEAVASAAVSRLSLASSLDLPVRLIRHGLTGVRCRHMRPDVEASKDLLRDLVEQGAPWPDLLERDVAGWRQDPAADTPFLMNVVAWGIKPDN